MRYAIVAVCMAMLGLWSGESLAEPTSPGSAQTTITAEAKVGAALAHAERESKKLFLLTSSPGCGWCKRFDQYHARTEVKPILDKYYVLAKVDTEELHDARAVFERYGKIGWPAWAILDAAGQRLINSDAEGIGNVGFPYRPEEVEHYVAALKKTSAITPAEIETLKSALEKTVPPKRNGSGAGPSSGAAPPQTGR